MVQCVGGRCWVSPGSRLRPCWAPQEEGGPSQSSPMRPRAAWGLASAERPVRLLPGLAEPGLQGRRAEWDVNSSCVMGAEGLAVWSGLEQGWRRWVQSEVPGSPWGQEEMEGRSSLSLVRAGRSLARGGLMSQPIFCRVRLLPVWDRGL